MNETKTYHHLPCNETPDNCNFLLRSFRKGETFSNTDKGMNYIVFCQKGEVACSAKKCCTGATSCSYPAWLTARERYWKIPMR